jgi:hypothetical protein
MAVGCRQTRTRLSLDRQECSPPHAKHSPPSPGHPLGKDHVEPCSLNRRRVRACVRPAKSLTAGRSSIAPWSSSALLELLACFKRRWRDVNELIASGYKGPFVARSPCEKRQPVAELLNTGGAGGTPRLVRAKPRFGRLLRHNNVTEAVRRAPTSQPTQSSSLGTADPVGQATQVSGPRSHSSCTPPH